MNEIERGRAKTLLDLDVKTRFFVLCALISTLIFNIRNKGESRVLSQVYVCVCGGGALR